MYDERPYGDILRNERERNGYDLNYMSRRLHIRPDILMAIEQSDFDRMPARGYSKNMVRAYARALHLNEQDITDMFLDQARAHDVSDGRRSLGYSERTTSRSRDFSREGSSRYPSRTRERDGRYSDSRSFNFDEEPPRSRRRSEYSGSRSRSIDRDQQYDDMPRSRNLDRDRSESRSPGFSAGAFLQSLTSRGSKQETRVGRSFDTIGSNPPYARNNVNRPSGVLAGMNLPLLLIIVAIVIALIIVVVVITNGSHQATQNMPSIPISGLTDTSGTDSSASSAANDDDDVVSPADVVLPTDAEVIFEVASGQDSWIEVYEDGSSTPSIAEVVSGPATQVFDVSNSIKIRTANPSAVTITADGETVEMTNEGNGNYSYTFSFQDYLKKWKRENGVEDSSSSSSKSSSSSRSSSSKSS